MILLVGGLEHDLFFHILGIIIPTDFHIFQRDETTNQSMILYYDYRVILCFVMFCLSPPVVFSPWTVEMVTEPTLFRRWRLAQRKAFEIPWRRCNSAIKPTIFGGGYGVRDDILKNWGFPHF